MTAGKERIIMALIGILLIFGGIGSLIECLGYTMIRGLLPVSFFIKRGISRFNFKYLRNAILMILAGIVLVGIAIS